MKFRLEKKRKKAPPSKVSVALRPWRLQILVGFGLVTFIALIITALWYVSRVESWQIDTVEVIGGSTISPDTIEKLAREVLMGNYFHLVPHTFAPFYPHDLIEARILQLPRVKNIRTEAIEHHKLVIVFEEYQPYALACEHINDNNCYFLDVHGFTFAKAPELTGGAFIRYVDENKAPDLKQSLYKEDYIEATKTFSEALEQQLNLFVTNIVRHDDVDLSYILSTGAELKVSNRLSADEALTNLRTILSSEEFSDVADGSFHYIDLRFGDKVFVSKKELLEDTNSTTTEELN